jgi:gluconokinase
MSSDRVDPASAVEPFVLALDVGSTATRGDLYDATGRPLKGGRVKIEHAFTTGDDGTSEVDPEMVVTEVGAIVDELAARPEAAAVRGVAIDTFASSLVGVGRDGGAVTACYTYADSRCARQVVELRDQLDESAIQQRTGCRLHASYLTPRFRWLREANRRSFDAAARWMSLGEFVYHRLLGVTAAGTSTAAWTGMLDRRTGRWDQELLDVAGVRGDQFSELRDPEDPLRDVGSEVAERWPALAGAGWFPVIPDGFASNVGAGAADGHTVALAAATSGAMRILVRAVPDELPSGLWCYRVAADRWLVGGALNDVGRMVSWLESTLRLPDDLDLRALLEADPEPATPMALPYLSGERSTGWSSSARALVAGVSAGTTAPQLFRGAMEGVAISYARLAEQLASATGGFRSVRASGRVTVDLPGWLRVLADVLGVPVVPVTSRRVTLRGTALLAARALAPGVSSSEVSLGDEYTPVGHRHDAYVGRARWYDRLYPSAVGPS